MTIYHRIITSAVFAFAVCPVWAQDVPDMETDRPDQTEASNLVPPGWIQVETGFSTESTPVTDFGLDEQEQVLLYPSVLLRYGLLPSWELRLQVEMQEYRYAGQKVRGLNPIAIGTKIAVCKEEGLRPEVAFIGHITLPYVGNEEFRPEFIAPDFRFSASHTLADNLSLGYNLGLEWNGTSALSTGIYTLVLGADIFSDVGMFVELFGEFPELGSSAHNLHSGFTWSPLSDLQFDTSLALGLNEAAPDYIAGAGISFRFSQ